MTYENSFFVFGIRELDQRFSRALRHGATIAIIGFPGTGKTIFAATICYANALRGKPCTYISTQESREKFYVNMKFLGMDFEELEEKMLFKFVNLPLLNATERIDVFASTSEGSLMPASLEGVRLFMEAIETLVYESKTKVLVIDSISPLLRVAAETTTGRVYIQNCFYNLARILKGILVLTVEDSVSPLLKEITADVEYVADIVIRLVQEQSRGLLTRKMRLVKIRGAHLVSSEVPFDIRDGRGIKAFFPPLIEEIPAHKGFLKWPCRVLEEKLHHLPRNYSIYFAYNIKPPFRKLIPLILAFMTTNKMSRALIINYNYPSNLFSKMLRKNLSLQGIPEEKIRDLLCKLVVKTLNPTAMSTYEMYTVELDLVEEYKPDIVIFWDVHIPEIIHGIERIDVYATILRNQFLVLKSLNIPIIRVGKITSYKLFKVNSGIADVVFKCNYNVINPERSFATIECPFIENVKLPNDAMYQCIRECIEILKKHQSERLCTP